MPLDTLDVGALTCQLERTTLADACSTGKPAGPEYVNRGVGEKSPAPKQAGKAKRLNNEHSGCNNFDAGALSCQLKAESVEDECNNCQQSHNMSYKSTDSMFSLHDFMCHGDESCRRSSDLCFLGNSRFFIPCYLCQNAAATLVEVPCGHVAVCQWCDSGTMATGILARSRCVQCKGHSSSRIDISRYLDPGTGEPKPCFICHGRHFEVLSLPCGCLCHCSNCFPHQTTGCPSCGRPVFERVVIAWPAPELVDDKAARIVIPDAPQHEELLQWPPPPSAK